MKNAMLAVLLTALCLEWDGPLHAQNNAAPAPGRLAAPSSPPLNEPLHQKYTDEAWTAFQNGQYAAAITNADQCVSRFGDAAKRSQAALDSEHITLPTGTVSEADKQRIAPYAILHNVATCLLVKGWAEEKLGDKAAAKTAYTEATKLTLARCSRPDGETFWSPAEKAAERLARLQGSDPNP